MPPFGRGRVTLYGHNFSKSGSLVKRLLAPRQPTAQPPGIPTPQPPLATGRARRPTASRFGRGTGGPRRAAWVRAARSARDRDARNAAAPRDAAREGASLHLAARSRRPPSIARSIAARCGRGSSRSAAATRRRAPRAPERLSPKPARGASRARRSSKPSPRRWPRTHRRGARAESNRSRPRRFAPASRPLWAPA